MGGSGSGPHSKSRTYVASVSQLSRSRPQPSTTGMSKSFSVTKAPGSFHTYAPSAGTRSSPTPMPTQVPSGSTVGPWNPVTQQSSHYSPGNTQSWAPVSSMGQVPPTEYHVAAQQVPVQKKNSGCSIVFWVILAIAAVLLLVWGICEMTGHGFFNNKSKDKGKKEKKNEDKNSAEGHGGNTSGGGGDNQYGAGDL